MAAPRFLVESLPVEGAVAWLDREEARHAVGSRRLGEGDPVELVDGRGGVALARLGRERDHAGNLAAVVSEVRRFPRPSPALHVASAVPKGDRLGTMLDALGELAVTSFAPLDCDHSVTPAARVAGDRAGRILAEALKQSRGAWLTELRPASDPVRFAKEAAGQGWRTIVLDPRGRPLPEVAAGAAAAALLAGPEGGFSEPELRGMHEAGAVPASLGCTVLRVELAVAVACGALRAASASA
jgi:16S rRNA (uracil1498-N3)-methyltransferase